MKCDIFLSAATEAPAGQDARGAGGRATRVQRHIGPGRGDQRRPAGL